MKLSQKFIALFASLALVVSFVPAAALATTQEVNGSPSPVTDDTALSSQNALSIALTVEFHKSYSSSQGQVMVSTDGGASWTTITANYPQSEFPIDESFIHINDESDIHIKIVANEGWAPDDHVQYTLGAHDNTPKQTTADIFAALCSQEGYEVPAEAGGFGLYNVGFVEHEGPAFTDAANFTYTYEGEAADIFVGPNGGVPLPPMASGETLNDVGYTANDDNTVTITLGVLFISRLSHIVINDMDYTAKFPTSTADKLANFHDQRTWTFEIKVPKADNYAISTAAVPEEDPAIGNFLWSYMDKDAGTDDYLDHGRLEFVSYVDPDGTPWTLNDFVQGSAHDWYDGEDEGAAVLPAGGMLTVRLQPEYGHQLTSFTINGGQFQPGEEVGVYTFQVPKGNFHLGAHFTPVADAVSSSSDAVSGGTIQLGGTEFNSGTAMLKVSDAQLSQEQMATFASQANGYAISSYLDINLSQLVYKGTNDANNAWSTDLHHLNNSVTVSLQLPAGVNGSEVVLVHQKDDGTFEVIPAVYDPVTRTLTFNTSHFSNYAIAAKDAAAAQKSSLATTGDTLVVVPLGALLLATMMLALIAWRKRCL